VDGLTRDVRRRSFSWLQPVAVLAGLAVAAVSVGGLVWWAWAGVRGPVDRVALDGVPPYVRNVMVSDARARVLAVELAPDGVHYSVLADRQLRLGDADRGAPFGGSVLANQQAQDLVVRLVAGTADSDIAPQLSDLGIGYLWVRGAGREERARIDNTPGLGAASGDAEGTVWQLDPPVTRRAVVEGAGGAGRTPVPSVEGSDSFVLAPGPEGRRLLLGEPADPRWRATLDGAPLSPVGTGWQQGFLLPPEGGVVRYRLTSLAHWFLIAQGLLLVVAGVLAAPAVRRPEVRDPTRSARRAATGADLL
jgi:hypothetical protein